MPRGDNPKSRANLRVLSSEEARKNGKKGGKASAESRAIFKSLNEDLRERCTPDRIAKINDRILAMAEHGNLRAYELVRDGLGERPQNKVEISSKEDEMKKMDSILEQMGMIEANKEN